MRALKTLALVCAATGVQAEEEKPLWEIGVIGFGLYGPDYPAASEYSLNGLPAPYLVYRGKFLRISDEETAFIPVETPRYELGISAAGAFPAQSDGNAAREGLPDLDYLVEVGPKLTLNGPRYAGGRGSTELALQGRAVFSLDFDDVAYQGLVFEPELRTKVDDIFGGRGTLNARLGPIFASEGVHDYFYEVAPAFATPERPAFDADAGYLGTDLGLSLTYEATESFTVFGGAVLSVHSGAANSASPLFERDVTATAFLGAAFTFLRSDRPAR